MLQLFRRKSSTQVDKSTYSLYCKEEKPGNFSCVCKKIEDSSQMDNNEDDIKDEEKFKILKKLGKGGRPSKKPTKPKTKTKTKTKQPPTPKPPKTKTKPAPITKTKPPITKPRPTNTKKPTKTITKTKKPTKTDHFPSLPPGFSISWPVFPGEETPYSDDPQDYPEDYSEDYPEDYTEDNPEDYPDKPDKPDKPDDPGDGPGVDPSDPHHSRRPTRPRTKTTNAEHSKEKNLLKNKYFWIIGSVVTGVIALISMIVGYALCCRNSNVDVNSL
ncbi:hypothetical protein GPJ56_007159 [Histomonas meleagridis]|uniref:uncharacterized protein n=1 Tax=Histomonas meleagridis TaxID=135588 RepID=UPI0035599C09|nr:hypothetical protein GPJ56_007159 [Histomonas meleagridis]KAH0806177.1 hypothetical protein GO595_000865 [Histomonas meleagridis]